MRKLYILVLSCVSLAAVAQQDLQFTQFMFNRLYYNPGVAGSGDAICLTALHRSQWVGFDGAPTSQNVNANVPLDILHGGVSLKIANDQIGFFQNVNAALGYAYQHQLTTGSIGVGVSFELFTKNVDNAGWMPPDGLTSLIPINPAFDGNIPLPDQNGMTFDMNFGVYYESEKIWGGISASRILGSGTDLDAFDEGVTQFYNARHYYAMGGYNWMIPATNWEIRPSFLVKSDFVATQVDVNAMGVYNNKFWGGVSYRLEEAIGVNIGYQFTESLKAGYAYDIPISDLATYGSGSHEVFLRYCFKVEIPPREKGSYKNPRFL